jgi:hypothetical protein
MKKQLIMLTGCVLFANFTVKAQEQVTITKDYDDPYSNIWNLGVYGGLEVQSKSSGGLYYGASARFTLGKIATFQANMGLDLTRQVKSGGFITYNENLVSKLPSYKNIELRGVFHFRDNETEKNHNIDLGESGGYKYSTNYTTKARSVQGITASVNINSRMYIQNNSDSTQILKTTFNGADPGYLSGLSTGQNNIILGLGFHAGEYTYFKGKFSSGPTGTKTRRIKQALCANIEFLFAPVINVMDLAYYDNNGVTEEYKITDVSKKNLGFRLSVDLFKGKPGWFMRTELGKKPGIEAPLNSDSKMGKFLTNGYISFAFGLCF